MIMLTWLQSLNANAANHNQDCITYKARMESDAKLKKEHKKKYEKAVESFEDLAFARLMKEEAAAGATKPCPGCGEAITHVEGCDHHQCKCEIIAATVHCASSRESSSATFPFC